jgi:release factor glutamine methyltransferase
MNSDAPALSEADIVIALRRAGCVFSEDEAALLVAESTSAAQLAERVQRRTAGEPLEVILGWAEFSGLRIEIDPGVFVPRRRTEYLVRRAIKLATPTSIVVDLCCGSGAIGAALSADVPGIRLFAADIEPAAVECARRNLAGIGEVFTGDLFDPLPAGLRGHVDLLLVNAPYVPTTEIASMPSEARDYEPLLTLDGGADGLDVHRRVTSAAFEWLAPGGTLLIETSAGQASVAEAMFRAVGLSPAVKRSKKRGATVILGTRPRRLPKQS